MDAAEETLILLRNAVAVVRADMRMEDMKRMHTRFESLAHQYGKARTAKNLQKLLAHYLNFLRHMEWNCVMCYCQVVDGKVQDPIDHTSCDAEFADLLCNMNEMENFGMGLVGKENITPLLQETLGDMAAMRVRLSIDA